MSPALRRPHATVAPSPSRRPRDTGGPTRTTRLLLALLVGGATLSACADPGPAAPVPLAPVARGGSAGPVLAAPVGPSAGPLATGAGAPTSGPARASDPTTASPTAAADAGRTPGAVHESSAASAAGAGPTVPATSLLWQHAATGERGTWPLSGVVANPGGYAQVSPGIPTAWSIAATADFDGDGVLDIVWENTVTGEHGIWTMTGTAGTTWTGRWYPIGFTATAWHVAAAADFTGDGKPDLLWENTATGERGWYEMNGTAVGAYLQLGYVPAAWRIAAAADVTRDAKPDIVWQNVITGERGVWPMVGRQWSGHYRIITTIPAAWTIVAAADLNGDGKPDLLWENAATGQHAIWAMDQHVWTGNQYDLPAAGSNAWRLAGVLGTAPALVAAPSAVATVQFRITAIEAPIRVGATYPLAIDVRDAQGNLLTGRAATFTSLDPTLVTVDAGGTARAIAPGRARIQATVEGKSATTYVNAYDDAHIRIVLTWGARPVDLDATLEYAGIGASPLRVHPTTPGDCSRGRYACLFADVNTGFGPEIVAIYRPERPGIYRYSVHNWSREAPIDAQATVQVWAGYQHVLTLRPPEPATSDTWRVLEIVNGDIRPVNDFGTRVRFASLAAGASHTCGLTDDGPLSAIYCWGQNTYGQLGNGSTTGSARPVRVFFAQQVMPRSLTVGATHSCVLDDQARAYCWGQNEAGQLGDGTTANRATPTLVAGGAQFDHIVAGGGTTCGIRARRTYCWGANGFGQLGDGTQTNRATPTPIVDDPGLFRLAVGSAHVCAIAAAADAAYCWGDNASGQLGDGTTTGRLRPRRVAVEANFQSIAAAAFHTCATTTSNGATYCWGSQTVGQLGDGTSTTRRLVPYFIGAFFAEVGANGGNHTCGRQADGQMRCWGSNSGGRLGDASLVNRGVPTPVWYDFPFQEIAVGTSHTCGLVVGGYAYCWGPDVGGRLGVGLVGQEWVVPVPVVQP